MKSSLLAGAVILMAMCGSACAQPAPQFDPALYAVRDADSTIYLYGTVHVRPQGAAWGDADVRAALAESQEIWTELEISPAADALTQAIASQLGRAQPGRPLSSWLTAEENARLNALTARLNIPEGALEPFQPWMAAMTLSLVPILQAGYDPASGVDRAIDAFGDANGKTMRAFETPAEQLGFFTQLPDDAQRQFLREAIEEAERGPALIAELTLAWERGDLDSLEGGIIDDTREKYPDVYQALFVVRNNAWVETLSREMEGSGVDFVAVGAGHLIGDDGLVAQMRARGFTVERVGQGR